MADESRIADLERRVDRDPASIAFAHLAEEYRRAGRLDDAVRVCRAGLERHPLYPSARLTLGRALLEQGQRDDAVKELLAAANNEPDNLAAIRAREQLTALVPAAELPVLQELERWLEAIRTDRAQRVVSAPPAASAPEASRRAGDGGHHADVS